jgi:glycerol uptake facilitator-like aquaporin
MKQSSPLKWFIAEFIGTLILATAVGVALKGINGGGIDGSTYINLYTPFLVAAVVTVLVYVLNRISGAHFNPAVTVAMYAYRKITLPQLGIYLLAQILGAGIGFQLIVRNLMGSAPEHPMVTGLAPYMGEFIGAAIIVFVVMTAVLGKIGEQMAPVAIGLAFATSVTIAMGASGGILNPALSLGLLSFQIAYLIMPILGGLVGGGLATWLNKE